jgi:hypothetical protein
VDQIKYLREEAQRCIDAAASAVDAVKAQEFANIGIELEALARTLERELTENAYLNSFLKPADR